MDISTAGRSCLHHDDISTFTIAPHVLFACSLMTGLLQQDRHAVDVPCSTGCNSQTYAFLPLQVCFKTVQNTMQGHTHAFLLSSDSDMVKKLEGMLHAMQGHRIMRPSSGTPVCCTTCWWCTPLFKPWSSSCSLVASSSAGKQPVPHPLAVHLNIFVLMTAAGHQSLTVVLKTLSVPSQQDDTCIPTLYQHATGGLLHALPHEHACMYVHCLHDVQPSLVASINTHTPWRICTYHAQKVPSFV